MGHDGNMYLIKTIVQRHRELVQVYHKEIEWLADTERKQDIKQLQNIEQKQDIKQLQNTERKQDIKQFQYIRW